MNVTLDYLKSNRKWLVKNYRVRAADHALEADLIMTEIVSPDSRVVFHHQFVGDVGQVVEFADLTDHRGNQLPATLNNPEVLIVPRNAVGAFIPGPIGPTSFRIARSGLEPSDAVVDLVILEMN